MVVEELRTYLKVLWRYKWLIAACTIISSLVAWGISLQLTPIYSSTATVRVVSSPGGSADYTALASFTRLSNTYIELATSDITLNEVAKQLGLKKHPNVDVEIVPETELIRISASDSSPSRARDIANTLANMLVTQSTEFYGGNAPTAREILEEQLQQAKVDLDDALSEYERVVRNSKSSSVITASGTPVPDPAIDIAARLVSIRQLIYTDLLQKYETARTTELLRSNAIAIADPAFLPKKPTSPKIPINTALGLVAGLVGGIFLAFLFETMDVTLRGIEDIQQITSLPILCTIPDTKRNLGKKARLDFSRNGYSSVIAAFHQLQARVILSGTKPKSATFIITSPEPGAGKSTVAANLALALAEGGHRVVLVDMDFRRPRLHSILGLRNEKGLREYLCGELQLNAILQPTADPNLHVVVAGSSLHVPYEWLTPAKISSLLKTLGAGCNYLLIDTPALLSVADPSVLASQADAVILVVAKRKTKREHLKLALQLLTELEVNIMGIVLNRVSNSPLYNYYSDQKRKQLPFQQDAKKETITDKIIATAHLKNSDLDNR